MAVLLALAITVVAIGDDGGPPAPVPVEDTSQQGGAAQPTPTESAYGVWDRLAQCESTQNWSANTGNSYFGGLQFDRGTWLAYGGAAYASRADLASRTQQIAVAERLHAARGYQPWPACSRRLGLR